MSVALCQARIEQFAEPILVLEMRRFRRGELRVAIALVALIQLVTFAILSQCATARDTGYVLEYGSLAYLAIITLVVASYGSRSVKDEQKTGLWEALAVTSLKSAEIADQKILSAALHVTPLLIAGLPMAVATVVLGGASMIQAAVLGLMLVLGALLVSAVTIQFSCAQGLWNRLTKLHLCVVGTMVVCISFLMPHVLTTSAFRVGRDITPDPLNYWSLVLAIALLSCGLLVALLMPLLSRHFPKGHPRRRRAIRLLDVCVSCAAAIYLVPAIRDRALHLFWVLVGFAYVCATPIAAARELFGESMAQYRDMLPHGLPSYGVTVGTFAVQTAVFLLFRSMSATSIEKLRRTV